MPNGEGLDHEDTGGWADAVQELDPAAAETPVAPASYGSFADAATAVGGDTYDPDEGRAARITKGTQVFYNQVEIINATTLEWNEEVVYDNSGTDAIGTRYKLRFRGYIHVQGIGPLFASQPPTYINTANGVHTTATNAYIDIHKRLWEPRKTLVVKVGVDETVITCKPPEGANNDMDRDIENGPKPRGLTIVQIVNDQVYKVEWAVEFMKLDCRDLQAVPEVLNNRWSVSEEMDGDFYTTRTIRGHLRLSASNFTNPQNWRHLVVPGLEATFKREKIEYAVAENGLEIEYQVTDRQVYNAAPWPATDISGSYTSSTNDGITFTSACHVRLVGAPNSPRRMLIARAMQIVDTRLNYVFKRNSYRCFLESGQITESIGPVNTVEVSMAIREMPSTVENYLAHLRSDTLGDPLQCPTLPGQPAVYNQTLSPVPSLYGYNANAARSPAFLFLMACYLQSPCSVNEHDIYNNEQGGDPQPNTLFQDQTAVAQVPYTTLPALSQGDKVGLWNPDQLASKDSPYTYCRAESEYKMLPCRAQLPIAVKVEYGSQGNGNQDTCVFIDLAPGIAVREMVVDCERMNAPPKIPEPQDTYTDGQIRGKLLAHHVVGLPSTLSADGQTRLFRVRAYYRWGMNRMPNAYDNLKLGALPFTSQTAQSNVFSGQAQYDSTLGP